MKFLPSLKRLWDNWRQYRKRLITCPAPPFRVWIEPTNRCNLTCPMCPTGLKITGRTGGTMKLSLFREVIDQVSAYAVDINLFYGGESLLHPQLMEMIAYAKQTGLRVRLETNATLLDSEKAGRLLKSGLDFLSVSFDGYTRSVYEEIRQGARFEETVSNVVRFLRLKKEWHMKKPFTLLQVIRLKHLTDRAEPRDEREFMRNFRGLPLNGVRTISPHRFAGQIDSSVTGNLYGYVGPGNPQPRVSYVPCPYLWFGLAVTWEGDVVPCCMDMTASMVLGNVRQEKILDLWDSAKMHCLREAVANNRRDDYPRCVRCDLLNQPRFGTVSLKNSRDFVAFLRESVL